MAADQNSRNQAEVTPAVARRQRRRLLAGDGDVTSKNVLDLLDRVDAPGADPSAGRELVGLAKLNPDAISEALIQAMLEGAAASRQESILEALFELSRQRDWPGRDELLPLARLALLDHWGRDAAAAILGEHAQPAMVGDPALWARIVATAGPISHGIGVQGQRPRPAPLLRLFDVAQSEVEAALTADLAAEDQTRQLHAALAARYLMKGRPVSAARLVAPLIDALGQPSRKHAEERREARRHVLGTAIAVAPETFDAIVDASWATMSDRQRHALLVGYDGACRDRLSEPSLPRGVATSIARRALTIIASTGSPDLLHDAAETLALVCQYFPIEVEVPQAEMVAVLGELCKVHAGPQAPGAGATDPIDWLAASSYRAMARDEVSKAIVNVARVHPGEFWSACSEAWASAVAGGQLRFHLTDMVAALCKQHELLPQALPMLAVVLEGDDVNAKAAILWAYPDFMDRSLKQGPFGLNKFRFQTVQG